MEIYALTVNFPLNKALDNQDFTAFSKDNFPRDIQGVRTYCRVSTLTRKYGKYLKHLKTK
jgi:hypothetical protein